MRFAKSIPLFAVAVSGLAFTGAAHAEAVSVRNDTGKPLKFQMKCTTPNPSAWTEFAADPGVTRTLNYPKCKNYLFEMRTTHRKSGAVVEVKYNWASATKHVLVWNDAKGAFDSKIIR